MLKFLTAVAALVAIAYVFVFALGIDPYYNYIPTHQDSINQVKIKKWKNQKGAASVPAPAAKKVRQHER